MQPTDFNQPMPSGIPPRRDVDFFSEIPPMPQVQQPQPAMPVLQQPPRMQRQPRYKPKKVTTLDPYEAELLKYFKFMMLGVWFTGFMVTLLVLSSRGVV